jgi:hypothetical protein
MSTYTETDTSAPAGGIQACYGSAPGSGPVALEAVVGGTAGSATQTITVPGNSLHTALVMFQSPPGDPGYTPWPAGTWTVNFDLTGGNSHCTLEDLSICRLSASYSNLATVASISNQAISCANPGTLTISATNGSQQAANTTDVWYAILAFKNSDVSGHNLTFRSDLSIVTPLSNAFIPPKHPNSKFGWWWRRARRWKRRFNLRAALVIVPSGGSKGSGFAPTGTGCPTYSIKEILQAAALITEAGQATALIEEANQASARIQPCAGAQ